MARYIELEKAIKVFEIADADVCANYGADYGCEFGFSRDAIRRELEQLPAADVVEVVLCKDCNGSQVSDDGKYIVCCRLGVRMGFLDFCSRGGRKDDDNAT